MDSRFGHSQTCLTLVINMCKYKLFKIKRATYHEKVFFYDEPIKYHPYLFTTTKLTL
jgi:hypothetical protein